MSTFQPPLSSLTPSDRYYYLWVVLARTRDATYRVREMELKPYGLKPEHSLILLMVRKLKDKATPAEVARHTFRKPHTISVVVKGLVKRGFLKKGKDPKRKNLVILSLTREGEKVFQQAMKREAIERIMSHLSDKECEQLNTCLHKLIDAAGKEIGLDHVPVLSGLTDSGNYG